MARLAAEASAQTAKQDSAQPAKPRTDKKPRLTFKERKEKEQLEEQLPRLEEEKRQLEADMSSGTMDNASLIAAGDRMAQLVEEIDAAEMRLLELLEIEDA